MVKCYLHDFEPYRELKMTKTNSVGFSAWQPLLVACLAQIGTSGDNVVLSMATNEFIHHLDARMDQVQLANIVYSLLAGALCVFCGMLGIAKGFKKVLMIGAAFCAAGEAMAVVAPSMDILVWGARSLTGLGAALILPSILGIIVSLYVGKDRAVAFGTVGAATGVAIVVMPIGAGLIIDASGYQAAFGTMSVWFVIVFLAAWKWIPNIEPENMRVDYAGTVFVSFGLVMFIIGCSKVSTWGFIVPMAAPFTVFGMSPALPLALLGMVVMFITTIVEKKIEQKHHAALIPQSFLKSQQVRSGLYITGLIFLIFGSTFFIVLAWIMVVAGSDGITTGVAMAIMATPMIILSVGIPQKFSHWSPRMVVMSSTGAGILGTLAMLASLRPDGFDSTLMYLGLALAGTGLGGFSSQSAMVVAAALNPRDAAQSGGIQCSTRNVWQATGIAIIGAVLLFNSTEKYKTAIAESTVAPVIKEYVAKTAVHGFVSNKVLIVNLLDAGAIEEEVQAGLEIYKQTRIESAQLAFWSLILLILLHVPGFMGIQTEGWTKKVSATPNVVKVEQI